MIDDHTLLWIVGQLVSAAAIYGGIRADIKSMHARIDALQKLACDAHSRLDNHLEHRAADR